MAELGTRKPLFDGKCERNQLSKIFEVLGTPDDENWPENAAVLKSNFVCMPKKAFCDVLPGLDPLADDLLEVSFALTPDFFKRALLNYWGVSNQSQTGMDERPIWVHKFSRKKQIPHGSIHPLPQHILLVKFRTVKTKMIIKS